MKSYNTKFRNLTKLLFSKTADPNLVKLTSSNLGKLENQAIFGLPDLLFGHAS